MKLTMTNEEMAKNIDVLSSLKETGVFAYAIARNIRRLKDAAKEYLDIRTEAYNKYGEEVPYGNGKKLLTVPKEHLGTVEEMLKDVKDIKHSVIIFQVDEDMFISGSLTCVQMETLLWMVKDENKEDK